MREEIEETVPIAYIAVQSRRGMCHSQVTLKEEGRVERKQRECVCPLSWSVHHNLARDGYIESTCCCVEARF
jgi:hypothetical protein